MSVRFTCKVNRDGFIDETLSSLSPYFDLTTLVDCERKCKNSMFESENNQKVNELNNLLMVWQSSQATQYLISGNWLRQWSYYIFVCHCLYCNECRKMEQCLEPLIMLLLLYLYSVYKYCSTPCPLKIQIPSLFSILG